jgi:hypothetical protein
MPAAIALPVQHTTPRPLSPPDISQFIRLDQCERYLRVHERIHGARVLRNHDVTPQSIQLFTRSGADFEWLLEQAVA